MSKHDAFERGHMLAERWHEIENPYHGARAKPPEERRAYLESSFRSDEEIAKLPGVRVIDAFDMAPGPSPEIYAESRQNVQRNLYRIPLR